MADIISERSLAKFRRFWLFFGSSLIVSVAYMDPGNFGTSISAGSSYGYSLLWVVWLSSGMAMLFQYLSGKLGIAGYSIAELVKKRWSARQALAYWVASEAAILATDVAEFLGIAIALNLLFGIPLIIAALISVLDVFLLLLIMRKSFRTVEYAFILFVSIIAFSYVYELFITGVNTSQLILHSVAPNLGSGMLLIAVGIIGATVMPHALFVHSWLTKNKARKVGYGKAESLKCHKAETAATLFVAGLVNAAILVMAAQAFGGNNIQIVSISQAYQTLVPLFGVAASVVFALALLFSGISSSITGTFAGQSIMESLTSFKLSIFARRIITRFINLVPIVAAVALNVQPLQILVYSQVVLSLLIPLPLIPLVYYTAKRDVMGSLVNRKATIAVSCVFTVLILLLNAYLIVTFL